MPLRKTRQPSQDCSLQELLNWVAHDDFSGPVFTSDEVAAGVFGIPDNVEAIEIAQYQRGQVEDAAKEDILDALKKGEITASGFTATSSSGLDSSWKSRVWDEFEDEKSDIPVNAFFLGAINWLENSVRYPSGMYASVTVPRIDVTSLWPEPKDQEGTATKIYNEPQESEKEGKDQTILDSGRTKLDNGKTTLDQKVPAADRTVSLDHNSHEYKEAVTALDRVVQEFRDDHHLDNDLGHEKGALLKTLEGAQELLKDTTVNARVAYSLTVEPLKRIIEKYDQVLVGAFAATALAVLSKLLGFG